MKGGKKEATMTEKEIELIYIPGKWDINYRYSAGKTVSYFLTRIRDYRKIMGIKCSKCQRVIVPPRSFCERCFIPISDWVELGNKGSVEAFTFVYETFEGYHPHPMLSPMSNCTVLTQHWLTLLMALTYRMLKSHPRTQDWQ